MPAPARPSRRTAAWIAATLGIGALAGALLGCRVMYDEALSRYRSVQALRLSPLELESVPAAELAPLPPGADGWVFFGDSRAAQWPAPSVAGMVVRNLGVSGQTTAQVQARLPLQLLPLRPQRVLLQVGVNDLKSVALFPERGRQIVDDTCRRIDEMVAALRAGGAEVVLTTIFPTAPVPLVRRLVWSAEVDVAIDEVNRHIASRAGPGVRVFDAAAVLRGPDGRVQPAYARDFLHLSDAGYAALNQALLRALRSSATAR